MADQVIIHCEFNRVDEGTSHFIIEEEFEENDYQLPTRKRVAAAETLAGKKSG